MNKSATSIAIPGAVRRNSSDSSSDESVSSTPSSAPSSFTGNKLTFSLTKQAADENAITELDFDKRNSSGQVVAIPNTELTFKTTTANGNPLREDSEGLRAIMRMLDIKPSTEESDDDRLQYESDDESSAEVEPVQLYILDEVLYKADTSEVQTEVYLVTRKAILRDDNKIGQIEPLTEPRIIKIFTFTDPTASSEELYNILERSALFLHLLHPQDPDLQCIHYNGLGEGFIIINQPYYPGVSLDHYLKNHFKQDTPWSFEEKLHFIEVAEWIIMAIQETHKLGIIHGDIKPGNIIIDSDNKKAYLVDFEGSALMDPNAAEFNDVVAATLRYIAPECYTDYALDTTFKATTMHDVHCAGLTLLAMLNFGYNAQGIDERELLNNFQGRGTNHYTLDVKFTLAEDFHNIETLEENNKASTDNKLLHCVGHFGKHANTLMSIIAGMIENNPDKRWTIDAITTELASLKQHVIKDIAQYAQMKKVGREVIQAGLFGYSSAAPVLEQAVAQSSCSISLS